MDTVHSADSIKELGLIIGSLESS